MMGGFLLQAGCHRYTHDECDGNVIDPRTLVSAVPFYARGADTVQPRAAHLVVHDKDEPAAKFEGWRHALAEVVAEPDGAVTFRSIDIP